MIDKIKADYLGRIIRVMDFVENNLDADLNLAVVSAVAHYSPFHFHRLFSAITGEAVNAFIQRKRIEKIASLLLMGTQTPIADLAFQYGYKNASSFSRAFKNFYGVNASEVRQNQSLENSKIGTVNSKNSQSKIGVDDYICSITNLKKWIDMNAQIEVKEMPEIHLVGMNHMGDYNKIGMVYEKLFRWAGPKGLLNNPNFKTATLYHDDPNVTELAKVRQSACITVDGDVKVDGEVTKKTINKGKFAVGRFEITEKGFEKAWNGMCVWVEENGYKNRDGEYYELYHNDHTQHPERKFILDICIPVD